MTAVPLIFALAGMGEVPFLADPLGADSVDTADVVMAIGSERTIIEEGDDLEASPGEQGKAEYLENLFWLQEHPLDLNEVTRQELESLPHVTSVEAGAIIRFRELNHRFTSVDQLAALEGCGEIVVLKVRPYLCVKGERNSQGEPRVRLRVRGSGDPGANGVSSEEHFLGPPFAAYSRLTVRLSESVEMGGLLAKDPGERFVDGASGGFIALRRMGPFSSMVLGDFVYEAGQGLVFWGPSRVVGSGISTARKSALGVRPYRSAGESGYLRGIGLTVSRANLPLWMEVSLLLSRRSLGATVDGAGAVSGLYDAGLYRTDAELAKRNVLREDVAGGRISVQSPFGWSVGATYTRTMFDRSLVADRPFEFSGTSAEVAGFDFDCGIGGLDLFGEAAVCRGGGVAGVGGAVASLDRNASVSFVYREYTPRFNSAHAGASGMGDATRNERGIRLSWEWSPHRRLRVGGSFDQFKYPWRTYLNPVPSSGSELTAECDLQPLDDLRLKIRVSLRRIESAGTSLDLFGREICAIAEREQQKARVGADFRLSRRLSIGGRVEVISVTYRPAGGGGEGILLYQEISYRPRVPLTLLARLVLFQTGSYDTRLYEYEDDVPGTFSNPPLYGRGRRWYLIAKQSIGAAVRISAKYSSTQREQSAVSASGVLEAPVPDDRRIAVQVDLQIL